MLDGTRGDGTGESVSVEARADENFYVMYWKKMQLVCFGFLYFSLLLTVFCLVSLSLVFDYRFRVWFHIFHPFTLCNIFCYFWALDVLSQSGFSLNLALLVWVGCYLPSMLLCSVPSFISSCLCCPMLVLSCISISLF